MIFNLELKQVNLVNIGDILQRSRMSDLPPSTLPDDEKPGTSHSDHEEKINHEQDEENATENETIDNLNDEEKEIKEKMEVNEESDEEESDDDNDDDDDDGDNDDDINELKENDDKKEEEEYETQIKEKSKDPHEGSDFDNEGQSEEDMNKQALITGMGDGNVVLNQNKEEESNMRSFEENKQEFQTENIDKHLEDNGDNIEEKKITETSSTEQESGAVYEMNTVFVDKQDSVDEKYDETDNDDGQDKLIIIQEKTNKSTLDNDPDQDVETGKSKVNAIESKDDIIQDDDNKEADQNKDEIDNDEDEDENQNDDDEDDDDEEEETDIEIDNENETQSREASQTENIAFEDNPKKTEDNQSKEHEEIKIDGNEKDPETYNETVEIGSSHDMLDNGEERSDNKGTSEDYNNADISQQGEIQEDKRTELNKIEEETKSQEDKEMEISPMPLPIQDTGRKTAEDLDQETERSDNDSRKTDDQSENGQKEDKERSEDGSPKARVRGKRKRKKQQEEKGHEETTKDFSKVGKKKEKERRETRPLTTVLLSRKEEEKKRAKAKDKTKQPNMAKMAKSKVKKFNTRDANKENYENQDLEEGFYSSEEETRPATVGRSAPFIAQYNNKKRIEHILEQQHYWSDPEADREFGINKSMTTIPWDGSSDSASEYEEITGKDGIVHRIKKSKHVEIIDETNSEPPPSTKREKSFDSMTSVEDPESPGGHVSKKRLNEQMKAREKEMAQNGDAAETNDAVENDAKSKTKIILVKENVASKRSRGNRTGDNESNESGDGSSPVASDFGESEMDKLSERDSGLDNDGDEAVDVVLDKEQQAMIVSMLFDEEMNLRPQFARDEDGRIIRRLDNTVIYDPHTGRFTFHKQLGKIFNVPRLKRDGKGRPIGGYVEDPFGPRESEMRQRTPSSRLKYRTSSGRSIPTPLSSNSGSPSPDLKRSRGDVRNVGFMVPDDDAESWTTDQLDMHKRGRRDIGSALRRKLNKRLFRKKRQGTTTEVLPDVSLKKAWTQQDRTTRQTTQDGMLGSRGVTSLNVPYSRTGTARGVPSAQRRPLGTANSEQQQMYRQGLERDKKILEGRQDIRNKSALGAFDQETVDEDSMSTLNEERENEESASNRPSFYTSQSFYNDNGRLVVREQGCPDLQESIKPKPLQRPSTFFTIVRSKEDLEGEVTNEVNMDNNDVDRNCKSAPSFVHQGIDQRYKKENTFHLARRDGSESQLSGIDNNKLRKLLEELYRDKKYFDEYIESKEPESEAYTISKGLAEHGRGYLMERAEFWDKVGPLPPKPPMTDVGWKMYRQQTMLESRLNTDRCSKISNSEGKGESDNLPGVILSQEGVDDYGCNESKA